MQRTRVKICGITNAADALAAYSAGADALGFVFYADSPRHITPEQAQAICRQLPPFVSRVGLFVNAGEDEIRQVLNQVRLDVLQFHGDETADFCDGYGLSWLKAVRMRDDIDLHKVCEDYAACAAILLDSHVTGVPGGSGVSFDWQRIPTDLDKPVILAGGLQVENVGQAIRMVKPYGVDVSGGVEKHKGRKDPVKMRQFISEVIHAQDRGHSE
ncbi:MAG: phosphoribosylanthranilate isomerase [Gammaproteobacteria bacterium]